MPIRLKIVALKSDSHKNAEGKHPCGHLFVARGVSRDYIMQILGHSSLKTTHHYSRIMPEDIIREIKNKF